MGTRVIKHLCLAVGVLVLAVLIIRVRRGAELERRFDRTRLIGLSTGEVARIVGPPDFVVEGNIWLYFDGRTPYADLRFQDGQLQSLERFQW